MQTSVIFLTGMSGAGRSTALKIFEDLGYAIIDNLPYFMLPELEIGISQNRLPSSLVVGFDVRSFRENASSIITMIERFKKHIDTKVIFLDCQDDILMRRYNVTRHRHPLTGNTIKQRIQSEREILKPIQDYADHVIDTSFISVVMLGRVLMKVFAKTSQASLDIHVISFSYKKGLPIEADIVFDARFLDNPYYEENLQHLTGHDPEVQAFINRDKNLPPVMDSFKVMLNHALIGYKKSGRTYLTIAVGCTGGQHRSVFLAETLAEFLNASGEKVRVEHREL